MIFPLLIMKSYNYKYFFLESLGFWHTDNWYGGVGATWADTDVWYFLLVQYHE